MAYSILYKAFVFKSKRSFIIFSRSVNIYSWELIKPKLPIFDMYMTVTYIITFIYYGW